MNRANPTSRAACVGRTGRKSADLAFAAHQDMQLPFDVDELEQPVVTEFIQQVGNEESCAAGTGSVASVSAQGAQCPGAYCSF